MIRVAAGVVHAHEDIVAGETEIIRRGRRVGGNADAAAGEVAFGPQVLAGGRAVLFTLLGGRESKGADPRWDDAQIVVQALDSGQRSVLVRGGTAGQYVPTGHLLYVRQGTLFAMPFDEIWLHDFEFIAAYTPAIVRTSIRKAIDFEWRANQ
jgi:hypothetical protein